MWLTMSEELEPTTIENLDYRLLGIAALWLAPHEQRVAYMETMVDATVFVTEKLIPEEFWLRDYDAS